MKISIIAAMASNRVIGSDNRMPWHLPADLKRFKELTTGHPVIMGRKTFEAVGKALPGRTNIVITRDTNYQAHGCLIAKDPHFAMSLALMISDNIFVIGGARIYEIFIPIADEIYLTTINQDFSGSVTFPKLDPLLWVETAREDILDDPTVPFTYSFTKLERKHYFHLPW